MLEIKELTKQYGTKVALDHFSYVFEKGVYGILGANGAGKSTLMNLLTDNIRRTSGEIFYNGGDILKMGAEYRAKVGYMPQQQGMYDQFSARRFLYYMASLKGIPRKETREQVEELLEVVNLTEDAHRKLGGFSGGMRQRVLLAQALLGKPEILILDEPTAGLDPGERIRIRNFISRVAQDRIVLLATHVVTDIECIANQVLLMKDGHLIKSNSPSDLIASIEGKAGERYCTPEEIEYYQSTFQIGNVFQRKDGQVLRLVGDNLPEGFEPVRGNLGLEDVFLYYGK